MPNGVPLASAAGETGVVVGPETADKHEAPGHTDRVPPGTAGPAGRHDNRGVSSWLC